MIDRLENYLKSVQSHKSNTKSTHKKEEANKRSLEMKEKEMLHKKKNSLMDIDLDAEQDFVDDMG